MNKKAILILAVMFVLIVGTLGVLIFLKNQSSTPVVDTTPAQTGTAVATETPETPPAEVVGSQTSPEDTTQLSKPSGAIKLTSFPVLGASLFYRGTAVSFFKTDGSFYQAGIKDNGLLSLEDPIARTVAQRTGISKILWPNAGNGFIAELQDLQGKKRFAYFNGTKNSYTDLPAQISSISWLAGGERIIYVWIGADGKAVLSTANADASGYKNLVTLYDADVEIKASPSGQGVLFYRTNNPAADNKIVYVTSDGKLFKTVVKDGFNYGVSWAPDSLHFVYGRKNASGDYVLYYTDIAGDKSTSLGIVSSPDKVTWSQDSSTIIVAGKKLTGEVKASTESVFKIYVADMSKEEFETKSDTDARELFLDLKEEKVFFKNYVGGELYYIDISTPSATGSVSTPTQTTSSQTQATPNNHLP